jgi:glutaminase
MNRGNSLRKYKVDRGEATTIASVVGALATGAPFILAVTGYEFGNSIIWAGAIVAALTAIGVGVAKLWRVIVAVVRNLDQINDLVIRAERMEERQVATQRQLWELSRRFDSEHPPKV